jgi:hypothetical protein
MTVEYALVVRRVHLTGHNHPITTNHFPNIPITVRSPHAIVVVHPLQEFEIHLEMRSQSRCLSMI